MRISTRGARVRLQTPTLDDAKSIAELANDRDIAMGVAETGGFPYPYREEDAAGFIARSQDEYLRGEGLHLVVRLAKGDKLIGMVGLRNIDIDGMHCEIGYWIGRVYWGKGYGGEAVRLMMAYAFRKLNMTSIYAVSFASNERSRRLLESAGFRAVGELDRSWSVAFSINSMDYRGGISVLVE